MKKKKQKWNVLTLKWICVGFACGKQRKKKWFENEKGKVKLFSISAIHC